jgi:hypothetical protein
MAHPRSFHDDDLGLAELRAFCLSLPGTTEHETHGRPNFRTKKIFAIYGATTKGAEGAGPTYPYSVLVKMQPGGVRSMESDPRFFTPAYYGPSGWIGLDFTVGVVDWELVHDLVLDSYRATAPRALVAQLEDSA